MPGTEGTSALAWATLIVPTLAVLLTAWFLRGDIKDVDRRAERRTEDADQRAEHRIDSLRAENRQAHADIGENINRVERDLSGRVDTVHRDLGGRIDTLDRRDRQRVSAAVNAVLGD